MEFHDVIDSRHSVRAFRPDPIPTVVLERILEAARRAPSANNKLPWKLVVVSDARKRGVIAQSGIYGRFLTQSPVVIVGLADPVAAPKWHVVDTAIALEHVVLAATSEGLGSCWIGSFDEAVVKEVIQAPANLRVVALIALGYQRKGADVLRTVKNLIRPTRSLEELASLENFSSPWSRHQ